MRTCPESLRVIPTDWTSVLNLERVFGRSPARLEVDIGCGKGRFLLARAKAYPAVSFLGIDRLLARVLKVERKALRKGLFNIRVFYVDACYAVSYLMPPCSVSAYYLFFPDPWPKRRHRRRRLFDRDFIDALARTLVTRGGIHIATDHMEYLETIRGILSGDPRFTETPAFAPGGEEQTEFQLVFSDLNTPVESCSFKKIQ